MSEREFKVSPGQHRKIAEAIASRDADEAGSLMRQHVHRTFDVIFIQ